MPDPSEHIIGRALISGDHERGMREITCNAACVTRISCGCGQILDQHTCTVVESELSGRTVAVYCPVCWARAIRLWPENNYTYITWEK